MIQLVQLSYVSSFICCKNSTNVTFVDVINITVAYDKTGNVFNVTEGDITSNNTIIDTNYPSLA